jgi:hypothetical protein
LGVEGEVKVKRQIENVKYKSDVRREFGLLNYTIPNGLKQHN